MTALSKAILCTIIPFTVSGQVRVLCYSLGAETEQLSNRGADAHIVRVDRTGYLNLDGYEQALESLCGNWHALNGLKYCQKRQGLEVEIKVLKWGCQQLDQSIKPRCLGRLWCYCHPPLEPRQILIA